MTNGRNQLNHGQRWRLCKWIEGTANENAKLSHAAVAEKAEKALGFKVTEQNVYAGRKTTGVVYKIAQIYHPRIGNGRENRAGILAKEIVRICNELGMTPSDATIAIAKHERMPGEES